LDGDSESGNELEECREQEDVPPGRPDEAERVGEQPRQVTPRPLRPLGVHDLPPRAGTAAARRRTFAPARTRPIPCLDEHAVAHALVVPALSILEALADCLTRARRRSGDSRCTR
jgi:hypothetical protein